ncbi:DNA-binding response regulator [Parvibium lacunae]|uniref:DNA-binding response regulator n=2 Tax=Parvibium lacunae TaxID=1888893 RepID=A0A368L8L7_9BURK|nr:DNA-binding response regulator [Parvibium lacunae]
MMSKPINILLIDDHALFRSGVKSLLQRYPQFTVVGEAADGAEGLKRAQQLMPDVILLDLHMPGISGLQALQMILQERPQQIILMLTVSEDADDLKQALERGAKGYLLKNIDTDYLVRAIERAAQGEAVVDENMTTKLVAQLMQPSKVTSATTAEWEKLTPREMDVLQGLAMGESNKEIARRLDVAESTVKIHVQNILKKLNLSSRVQAAVYAVDHGLDKLRTQQ